MKFTLTYNGELRTKEGKGGRSSQRPALRRHFHKQLKRLWEVNYSLKRWSLNANFQDHLFRDWFAARLPSYSGIHFVPLVIEDLRTECALDFRILRSTEKIGNTADIDNLIKSLIDALKMPRQESELGDPRDYSDCNPLYTLVRDDSLVTRISSVATELLDPVNGKSTYDPLDCRVYIEVNIRPIMPTEHNIIFFSDEEKIWDHKYEENIPENLTSLRGNQLRAVATQCIFRIQALAKSLDGSSFMDNPREGEDFQAFSRRTIKESEARTSLWTTTLWPQAVAIRKELNRRIYGDPPYPEGNYLSAINHGSLAGGRALAAAAAELDSLVRLLP